MSVSHPITCYGPHSRSIRLIMNWPFLVFPCCVHIRLLRSEYTFMST
jgi:hypothetical protein